MYVVGLRPYPSHCVCVGTACINIHHTMENTLYAAIGFAKIWSISISGILPNRVLAKAG